MRILRQPWLLPGFREGICADAAGLTAPYFQAGMISGCSHVAGGLRSEQAAFGQCCCMRENMAKASCFQGFPLALAAPLALSVLPRQDSKGGGMSDVGGAPWHAVLGQCGRSLSPEG